MCHLLGSMLQNCRDDFQNTHQSEISNRCGAVSIFQASISANRDHSHHSVRERAWSGGVHYLYRCIHQMNLMLLRTCNFISGTGILFTHFLILSRRQIAFHVQVYDAYRSNRCGWRTEKSKQSFEFLSFILLSANERVSKLMNYGKC